MCRVMNRLKNTSHTCWGMLAAILLVFLLAAPELAAAAEPSVNDWLENGQTEAEIVGETEVPEAAEASLASIIAKLILYTLLILVLIYGLIKFLALRQQKFQPNQAVRLMGGTPLGNNKSLQLVKVGEQVYLLGVGDQITLIKEFSDKDEITGIEKSLDKSSPLLTQSILKFSQSKRTEKDGKKDAPGFESLFKQSLDRQRDSRNQLKTDLHQTDSEQEGRPGR